MPKQQIANILNRVQPILKELLCDLAFCDDAADILLAIDEYKKNGKGINNLLSNIASILDEILLYDFAPELGVGALLEEIKDVLSDE